MTMIAALKRWRFDLNLRRTEAQIEELNRVKSGMDAHLNKLIEKKNCLRLALFYGCRRTGMSEPAIRARKMIALCADCGKITAMADADTGTDLVRAAVKAKIWEDQGRKTGVLAIAYGAPDPEWCGCAVNEGL